MSLILAQNERYWYALYMQVERKINFRGVRVSNYVECYLLVEEQSIQILSIKFLDIW